MVKVDATLCEAEVCPVARRGHAGGSGWVDCGDARPGLYLAALGWKTVVTGLRELFIATGLPGLRRQDLGGVPVAGRYVTAALT